MRLAVQRCAAVVVAAAAIGGQAVAATENEGAAPQESARDNARLPFRKADTSVGESASLTGLLVLGLAIGGGALVAIRSGALRALRARRPAAQRAAIERLSTQMLAKGATLHAVRWHGEELLIGCTERQLTLLARRPADPVPREAE